MFECKIENGKGDLITLTQNESQFQVFKIDGLNPPNANINFTDIAGMDGARFNSSKLETRNLVIYIKLCGDVEANRILLYQYFSTKESCKFYYKNGQRDVFIEGYVQTVEVTPFTNNQIMQVSLICPQPYFKSIDEVVADISKLVFDFQFPFSINNNVPVTISHFDSDRLTTVWNNSDSESGVIIEITVLAAISKIMLRNTNTNESMTINNSSGFQAGDVVTINTYRGEKAVSLMRNMVKTNLFSMLQSGFTFFQLAAGYNEFTYQIDNGNNDEWVRVNFKYHSMYRGV